MRFEWAPAAAKLLNGVFCVYKPEGMSPTVLVQRLKENLAKDLNALPCYKFERRRKVQIKEDSHRKHQTSGDLVAEDGSHVSYYAPTVVTMPTVTEDLRNHRLVLGNRYEPSDFDIDYVSELHERSSGLMVCGIGESAIEDMIPLIRSAQFLRVYHVKCRFGYCTHDFTPEGPLIERTTFHHVNKVLIDRVCATIQASHQKHMFEYAGVHPQSQEAYEMASRGLVRPDTEDTPPMIYGVKCIHFQPPDATLEIHAINEECMYFSQMVNDIGLKLKSSAVCPQVRRIRYGHFTLHHALLRKHWHLEPIIDNIVMCKNLTNPDKLVSDFNIQKQGQKLLQNSENSTENSSTEILHDENQEKNYCQT